MPAPRLCSWTNAAPQLTFARGVVISCPRTAARGRSMQRVLFVTVLLIAAGCQVQNPYAAIGPATVPAPTTGQALPYYPPTVIGGPPASSNAAAGASRSATSQPARVSVSAEGAPSIATGRSAIVADPADRETIRIVENNSPSVRTANAATRGTPSAGTPTTPAASAPSGPITPPLNRAPAGQPTGYAPPASSPATNRMRGFAATPSATSEGDTRKVTPASYQQMAPTFSEASPADGQWRAR